MCDIERSVTIPALGDRPWSPSRHRDQAIGQQAAPSDGQASAGTSPVTKRALWIEHVAFPPCQSSMKSRRRTASDKKVREEKEHLPMESPGQMRRISPAPCDVADLHL